MRGAFIAIALLSSVAHAIIAPNTSLATVPCAYFGGNYAQRGAANVDMLSKMRLVMVEKWEGHCWQDCLGNGTGSAPCESSCGVENDILRTLGAVKAANPGVATVLYWNTLLAFPFYTAVGKFKERGLLTVDSTTHKPIVIRNDNGMEGIFVYGFDTAAGVQLYVDTVTNLTKTGVVDGFFGDKWGSGAAPSKKNPEQWQICNHECGNVTQAQGTAWNAGKAKALKAATAAVGAGPYFSNGDFFEGVEANLNGHWATDKLLSTGDPRDSIKDVKAHLANHSYFYMSCTGDQHWTTDPNDPAALKTACSDEQLARFLLSVEPGCFLGTNGWDEAYEKPLGDPIGAAVYTPANGRGRAQATLTRKFRSGTYVTFTYDATGKDGKSEIFWGGVAPTPAPPTPAPPTPAPVVCGACGSSLMHDTTFAQNDVAVSVEPDELACCARCAQHSTCTQWAWHSNKDCHMHGAKSVIKQQKGTIAGVMNRSHTHVM